MQTVISIPFLPTAPSSCSCILPSKNISLSQEETKKEITNQNSKLTTNKTGSYLSINDSESTFQCFWSLYPKKKNENRARSAWLSQRCYENAVEIIEKLSEQIAKDSEFLEGYAPNPDRYIMEEKWKEEVFIRSNKNKSNSKYTMAELGEVMGDFL